MNFFFDVCHQITIITRPVFKGVVTRKKKKQNKTKINYKTKKTNKQKKKKQPPHHYPQKIIKSINILLTIILS